MSKSGKTDYPDGNDDREDIRWFENYEKHSKTKHLERLNSEDILNYIKDVEQNCRLQVSSGDENYAGIKKFSNCSVRCSGTRFRSLRKVKSKLMSGKNRNMALKREGKRSSDHNATNACGYCCSARKSHFRGDSELTVRENSRRDLGSSAKSVYQHPNLSRNSYKYGESSPTLYGWYSRRNHRTWPAVTELASLEVTEDWSRNAMRDSRINRLNTTDGKTAKVHMSELLRGNKFDDSCYINIRPSIAANEKMIERDSRYHDSKRRGETRMGKLNESGVGDFENQRVNKIYSDRDRVFPYRTSLQNKGYHSSGCYYPVRSTQPTFWTTSRPDRLTSRLSETSSLLQGQTSQWENEIGPPLKAFNSVMGTSIDRSYQRETNRKNNTNRRRRRPDILGDRESLCYRRPGLLRESGKLCEVAPTHEGKQWHGCRCENAERDETVDCSRYCRRPENDLRPQRESTYEPVPMSERDNYTTLCITSPKSVRSDNDEEESEIYLSMEEDSQNEDAVRDNCAFDVFDDRRANNYDDATYHLKPHVSFSDDRARRDSSEVAREYKKLSNDLKSSQGEAWTARKKINVRYPADKEFSSAIRTPGKPASRKPSGLRYASTCECREPFHDPPAACLIGSCTCVGKDENSKRNNDSSRRMSDTVCCCCCSHSCSSSTSHDEKDPVKKLESFCERVKAVNQNIFQKPSKSVYRDASIDAREHAHGRDEQNQSEFSTQRTARRARSIEREWLMDPARLRLAKPRRSHSGANLEKILIYPPRGEGGPPLTLYKRSSNISCRVKGNADAGFRYNITYVQKFVSPTMPTLSREVLSREINKEYDCCADYD